MTTTWIFLGGCVQNTLVAAGIRYLSVAPSIPMIALTTFAVQGMWWVNIQAVKRTDRPLDGFAWCLGNVAGALLGFTLTGGIR